MEAMTVDVRLFAILRERAGRDRIAVELEPGATVADALGAIAAEPALAGLIERMPVTMAVNRDYATADTELRAGDELALIPPVSGGGADVHSRVSGEPLSLERVAALVSRRGAGAVVTFQGVTREVESLDYEAYVEMAEERIAAILADCRERHGLEAVAAEHRTGAVPLGEPSVIVAVAAAHRGEAFAGAREAIDRIKAEAPIWKREIEGGEARWVEGTSPA
ncbi:MAG: molybdenum cofactor biosynthesis protein MoaE [Thermoleophilia bacterium]|nr:molybdenum cofactor biosynthesis protein MoaE [Thermoleophilia bacterium]GIK78374.1 MAG: molybdenum cofactor biosynthesis protein D/E [Actinomycetes bacterium]